MIIKIKNVWIVKIIRIIKKNVNKKFKKKIKQNKEMICVYIKFKTV